MKANKYIFDYFIFRLNLLNVMFCTYNLWISYNEIKPYKNIVVSVKPQDSC